MEFVILLLLSPVSVFGLRYVGSQRPTGDGPTHCIEEGKVLTTGPLGSPSMRLWIQVACSAHDTLQLTSGIDSTSNLRCHSRF